MTLITVFRRVPTPVTGMIGIARDAGFERFEASLDWLESTGGLVERFDPGTAPAEVTARPAVQQALERGGESALPLVLVNGVIVSSGTYLSRTDLARAIGRGRRRARRTVARELAAIGALAALGTDDALEEEVVRARALGLDSESVRLAAEAGRRLRGAPKGHRVA